MSLSSVFKRAALGAITLAVPLLLSSAPASASVVARINKTTQRMEVYVDGKLTHNWAVSTAKRGFFTPSGSFRVGRHEKMWYSRRYHMSPMPNAMFFRGHYAIHGTYMVGQLGRPASHGCVRLHPANARALFDLSRSYGGTRVVIN